MRAHCILPLFLLNGLLLGLLTGAPARALNSEAYIERSVELIHASEYSLARTYLNPAVIDPRLSAGQRSRAYYLRGYSYFAQGLFVSASKDYLRALEFNPSNPGALMALGDLYFRGRGVAKDQSLAFTLFQSAAELGAVSAKFQMGYAYLEGAGAEQNVTLARQWLEEAAAEEHVAAMSYLGRSYREGYADPAEPETAREWYQKAAAAGGKEALVALAFMHQKGEFGEVDQAAAAALFEEAAAAGSSAAKVSLGHLHLLGEGVAQDPAAALRLFEEAAQAQNAASYLGLAHIYETGAGVEADQAVAEAWYLKAAEAGIAPAQLRLGYLKLSENDQPGAQYWLSRAASQDMPQAHNDYAWFLATSDNADLRDGALALEYAQRAVAKVKNPAYLDTLAAAYAELGQYADAIATQKEALALAAEGDPELREELEDHLEAYETGKPWRD